MTPETIDPGIHEAESTGASDAKPQFNSKVVLGIDIFALGNWRGTHIITQVEAPREVPAAAEPTGSSSPEV